MTQWTPQLHLDRRFWVGCAAALLGVSFLVAALLQSRDVRALARDGIPVSALVMDARQIAPTDGTSNDWTFRLTYTFTTAGQTITNERRVPEAFFVTHPVGTTWTMRVHPDEPPLHDLYPNETKRNTWGFLAAAAILIGVGGVFALSNTLTAIRARL